MKLFALFGFLTIVIGSVFLTHVIFVTGKSIEDITEALSMLSVICDAMAKMLAFYFMSQTYKSLLDSIADNLSEF
jgi:hypothetical protein